MKHDVHKDPPSGVTATQPQAAAAAADIQPAQEAQHREETLAGWADMVIGAETLNNLVAMDEPIPPAGHHGIAKRLRKAQQACFIHVTCSSS